MGLDVDIDEQCIGRPLPIRAEDARLISQKARDARKPDVRALLRVAYDEVRKAADRGENGVQDAFPGRAIREEDVKDTLMVALAADGYRVKVSPRGSSANTHYVFTLEW